MSGSASHDRFFVITGGPGSGKSTLIGALARAGYASTQEAGRAIIRHQVDVGGPALPWNDPALFAELMLCWDLRSYDESLASSGPVFFDRGVPDVVGYLRLVGIAVGDHLDRAARRYRYNGRVFIAPPWREIFTQDSERKQTFAEAVRTYEALEKTYRSYGYEIVNLPLAPAEERARFVLQHALGSA